MKTLSRSVLVGLVASAADMILLVFLVQGLGMRPTVANVPALLLGVVLQYVGNKYYAFEDRSRDHLRQGGAFALVEVGTLLLNAGGFHLAVVWLRMPYPIARIAVTLTVYLGFSLPLWRRIFRNGSPAVEPDRDPG